MSDFLDVRNAQHSKFLSRLQKLTDEGKVTWFRRSADPELVYCYVLGDLYIFEIDDDGGENRFEDVELITAKLRNQTLDWMKGSSGWDELYTMLSGVKINDKILPELTIKVMDNIISTLESSGSG